MSDMRSALNQINFIKKRKKCNYFQLCVCVYRNLKGVRRILKHKKEENFFFSTKRRKMYNRINIIKKNSYIKWQQDTNE